MKVYKIPHSNTDVSKLWLLAYNGVIDKRTVNNIFNNDVDDHIVFNSKLIYDLYKRFEFSTLAMYRM